MSRFGVWGAIVWVGLLSGCDKKEPAPPSEDAASATPSAEATSPVDASANTSAETDGGHADAGELTLGDMLGLGPRLAAEEKSRLPGGIRAEDVLATMKEAGAKLDPPKQHLASVWKALYCTAAIDPAEDFVVDVCELRDEKTAKETEATSRKGFGAVPGREVHRNGATLLTLRAGKPTAENKALAKKLAEAFAKMKPKPAPK